jgi:hypothetical protein
MLPGAVNATCTDVALALVAVPIVGAPGIPTSITILNARSAVLPALSVTLMVKLYVVSLATTGAVPVIAPVLVFKVNPLGSAPDTIL